MNITKIETIWIDEQPHNMWVRIHTDDGLIGLGETFYVPRAVSAVIHDVFADILLDNDPRDIEKHWNNMFSTVNFYGYAGAESRAISAVDVALWDIVGQHTGEPIYNLLGGRSRDRIRVYNTCVSYGDCRDYDLWRNGRSGELAEDLLKNGIKAMKIWPFDQFGVMIRDPKGPRYPNEGVGPTGHFISQEDLLKGISHVEDIRKTVGDKIEIAVEGHSRWDLTVATKIAHALEPYNLMWLEEIILPDNADAYARLKASTNIPLCVSERIFARFGFREVVEKNAADIIMPDLVWTGGITETRKICSLADTYYLPVTCHDCVGPVALWAATHMMLHIPNAMIMETVRAFYNGWYKEVVTEEIPISEGMLSLPLSPGLGTALREEVLKRPDVHCEISDLEHRKT